MNSIEAEGAYYISEGLKENRGLIELRLGCFSIDSCDLKDKGFESLSQALIENTTLELLDLSNNSAGSKGIISISESLKKNHSLTKLQLGKIE